MNNRMKCFLIVFLGMLAAMAPLSTDMYLPALPEFSNDFHISASLAQLTLTMTLIGMAVGQILGGPVSDYLGRRNPLLLGMAVFTAASVLCFITSSIHMFLGLRLIQGIAGAFGIVISRAIARDVASGPELLQFYSILMMVNGLAPIAAPVIGGQILRFTSWHGIFFRYGCGRRSDVPVNHGVSETLPPQKRISDIKSSFKSFPPLLKNRYFCGQCLIQCFVFGGFFTYIGGSSFLFQNIYHVSAQVYSYIFGFIGLGLLFMGALPARLSGTVSGASMLRAALWGHLTGAVLFLAGVLLSAPLWYSMVSLFIAIVPLSVLGASSTSMALESCGKNAGSASAILGFSSMVLGGVLMPVAGAMGENSALPMALIMVCCFALGLGAFYHYVVPAHRGKDGGLTSKREEEQPAAAENQN